MKSPLLYIIESLICSGLFLIVYQCLIARVTSWQMQRRFLLIASIAACVIPGLQIPVLSSGTVMYYGIPAETESNTALTIGLYVYMIGITVMLLSGLNQFRRIWHIRKNGLRTSHEHNVTVVTSTKVKTPFSFLRTIYLPQIDKETERSHIFAHELSHILHRHSLERIFMEVLKILFWLNPFIWLFTIRLVEVQELEADSDALSNGFGINDYRATLLKYLFGIELDMVNCMARHPLAKRFRAMGRQHKWKNGRVWLLVPMVMISIAAFALTESPSEGPVIVIDGQIEKGFDHIDPAKIKAITIIKDKKLLNELRQQYGRQAENGIIEIELINK